MIATERPTDVIEFLFFLSTTALFEDRSLGYLLPARSATAVLMVSTVTSQSPVIGLPGFDSGASSCSLAAVANKVVIALEIAGTSCGSTYCAQAPRFSRRTGMSLTRTRAPKYAASTGGRPYPSPSERKQNRAQFSYIHRSSSSGTNSMNTIAPDAKIG